VVVLDEEHAGHGSLQGSGVSPNHGPAGSAAPAARARPPGELTRVGDGADSPLACGTGVAERLAVVAKSDLVAVVAERGDFLMPLAACGVLFIPPGITPLRGGRQPLPDEQRENDPLSGTATITHTSPLSSPRPLPSVPCSLPAQGGVPLGQIHATTAVGRRSGSGRQGCVRSHPRSADEAVPEAEPLSVADVSDGRGFDGVSAVL